MAALAAGGLSLCGVNCAHTSLRSAENEAPAVSASDALSRLIAGNQKFVAGELQQDHMSSPTSDPRPGTWTPVSSVLCTA